MHALIIEDDGVVATSIEQVLRDCGFTSFDVAASAHAAIVAAALRRPDLITADVRLQSGCGIAAVEAIPRGSAIPNVFVTKHRANLARRVPNHIVVDKPFTATTLSAAVASAMLETAGDRWKETKQPTRTMIR